MMKIHSTNYFDTIIEVAPDTKVSNGTPPCLRISSLAKTYGYGIHSNRDSKIALYGMDSREYADLITDSGVVKGN